MRQAVKLITALRVNARDLSPVFHDVVDPSVTDFFEKRFATEGAHGGQRWQKLAPLTVKLRRRAGHGRGGILRDTGALWSSFIKGSGPLAVRRVTATEYERGSRVAYAAAHQVGWTSKTVFGRARRGGARKIPARPIVPARLPVPLVRSWEGAIVRHILYRGI